MSDRTIPEFLAYDRARDRWGDPLRQSPFIPGVRRPSDIAATEPARWVDHLASGRQWSGPHYCRPELTVRQVAEQIIPLGPTATGAQLGAIEPEYHATKCDACSVVNVTLINVLGAGWHAPSAWLCLSCVTIAANTAEGGLKP